VIYFLFLLLVILLYCFSSDNKNGDSKLCIVFTKCGDTIGPGFVEGWCEGQTGLSSPLTIESLEAFKDYLDENGAICSVK